jgi:Fe-S cluster biogenesis protein NfuA
MPEATSTYSRLQRLDDLIEEVERTADPAARDRLQGTVSLLLEIHGAALGGILQAIDGSQGDAAQIFEKIGRDPVISPVLVLHGMHPLDTESRVRQGLEKVAPYAASHGGHVELVSVNDDGVVSLRLEGSCHGCPSSRVTLQSTIEKEIYTLAPEVTSIVVEGLVDEPAPMPNGFIPLENLAINGSVAHATAL